MFKTIKKILSNNGGWIEGLISGSMSVAGNLAGSALSYHEQKKLLEKQQAFEREKALNAHQWEVQDLQNAGLNPILSAGGNGANVGSPSAPQAGQGLQTIGTDAVNSAIAAINQDKQNKQVDATVENLKSQNENLKTQNEELRAKIANTNQDTINKGKESGLIDQQTASELAKQNLTNAQTAKTEEETKQIVMNMQLEKQKLEEEVNILQAQYQEAISRKEYNKAKTIEQKIKNKWENANQITNQIEKYGNLLLKTADTSISAVKVATDALPVGTVTKMTKGLVSTIKSKKLPWQ